MNFYSPWKCTTNWQKKHLKREKGFAVRVWAFDKDVTAVLSRNGCNSSILLWYLWWTFVFARSLVVSSVLQITSAATMQVLNKMEAAGGTSKWWQNGSSVLPLWRVSWRRCTRIRREERCVNWRRKHLFGNVPQHCLGTSLSRTSISLLTGNTYRLIALLEERRLTQYERDWMLTAVLRQAL
jgi:hypothetical protein